MAHKLTIRITYSHKQVIQKLFATLIRGGETKSYTSSGASIDVMFDMDYVDIDRDLRPFLDEKKDGKCTDVKLFSEGEDVFLKKISDLNLDLDPRIRKVLTMKPDLTVGELVAKPMHHYYRTGDFKGLGKKGLLQIQDQLSAVLGLAWDASH